MHIGVTIWALFAAWKWANWKRWKEFLPTIYYMASMQLLYQYIAHSTYHLWHNERNIPNEMVTDSLYTFVIFPCTVMLFLSKHPTRLKESPLYYLKWVAIYASTEGIGHLFGFISYSHGWSWSHSLLFNCILFPMLRLHHVKPLWAIGISPIIICILLLIFY